MKQTERACGLNNPSFLQNRVSTTLIDGLDSAGGEGKSEGLLEFWHIDTLLLEVWIGTLLAGRVELGSTGPVGVTSFHLGTLI